MLAILWKKLVFLSPSFNHTSLDFCLQEISLGNPFSNLLFEGKLLATQNPTLEFLSCQATDVLSTHASPSAMHCPLCASNVCCTSKPPPSLHGPSLTFLVINLYLVHACFPTCLRHSRVQGATTRNLKPWCCIVQIKKLTIIHENFERNIIKLLINALFQTFLTSFLGKYFKF